MRRILKPILVLLLIFVDNSANNNGDDALELFSGGVVIDTFGDIATDGNGEPWEYLDGLGLQNELNWS